jgi:hypothetical protein
MWFITIDACVHPRPGVLRGASAQWLTVTDPIDTVAGGNQQNAVL